MIFIDSLFFDKLVLLTLLTSVSSLTSSLIGNTYHNILKRHRLKCLKCIYNKVQAYNGQEKAQSEKNSQKEKTKLTIRYLY